MVAKENFLKAHWDWLVAGVGLAALGVSGAFLALSFGTSPEEEVQACEALLAARKPAHEGVPAADLTVLQAALRQAKTPPALRAVDGKKANFLSSERRLFCKNGDPDSKKKACGRPIPDGFKECPFCGVPQLFEKVEIDADGDGLPNDWETKYGLNPQDASDAAKDLDKDGFTNLEEFQAKTDPADPKSHPEYWDSLAVASELRQTFLPFWLRDANPIPGSFRLSFVRVKEEIKNRYEDTTFSVKVGEGVKSATKGKYAVDTGYVVKKYTPLTEMRDVPGAKGGKKRVDVSTVELARADGKIVTARVGEKKVPVETQIDLVYRRGEEKTFTVSVGSEIELNGEKFRVTALKPSGKGAEVTIQNLRTKKQKVLR